MWNINRRTCDYDILEALFEGKICPRGQIGVTGNKEYDQLNEKIGKELLYFKELVNQQDCERLEALENLYSEMASIQDLETFTYGFRLGMMLMAEVFTGKDIVSNCENE